MVTYRARQGDTVDLICWRYYNTTDMTEAVYRANHGLADFGDFLPIGMVITLPDKAPAISKNKTVSLWD